MKTLPEYSLEELSAHLAAQGEASYRAKQIYAFVHQKNAKTYAEMTSLPQALRTTLARDIPFAPPAIVKMEGPDAAGSRKYLLRYPDGATIEAVLLVYRHGNSLCISSQVGCRMGCAFCASTLQGCDRNLTAGEMLSELYVVERDLGERISHIVIMGSGEPLDNYEEVIRFLRMVTDENGHNLSARNITLSTCGLVPEMLRLAEEGIPINLAISLHAPSDELRKKLMPIAKTYRIAEVLEAADVYFEKTHRRITVEYSLIAGVNDGRAEAKALAGLLRGKNVLVNLIAVNPIPEKNFAPPSPSAILVYKKMLENDGINVTIRRGMGSGFSAACGQLRKHFLEEEPT